MKINIYIFYTNQINISRIMYLAIMIIVCFHTFLLLHNIMSDDTNKLTNSNYAFTFFTQDTTVTQWVDGVDGGSF